MRDELPYGDDAAPDGNRRRLLPKDTANSMTRTAQMGFARRWTPWAAALLMILGLPVAMPDRAPAMSRGSHRADAPAGVSVAAAIPTSVANSHSETRDYFMDFAGDHSLDVATVIEQPSAGYTKYTVQLHLASGAEQSVVVSAPPGGLQVEMHDMTGDKIQNDVVLRPALVRRLPMVLVNDGHEHFDVAVSSPDPSTFSSSEDLGSRPRDSQTFALLMSSGFKAIHLPNSRRVFDPQLQECLFSSFTQATTNRLGHASSPGRAPPLAIAI